MADVYIIGVGMTRFGRYLDDRLETIARGAVEEALTDAGIARCDV